MASSSSRRAVLLHGSFAGVPASVSVSFGRSTSGISMRFLSENPAIPRTITTNLSVARVTSCGPLCVPSLSGEYVSTVALATLSGSVKADVVLGSDWLSLAGIAAFVEGPSLPDSLLSGGPVLWKSTSRPGFAPSSPVFSLSVPRVEPASDVPQHPVPFLNSDHSMHVFHVAPPASSVGASGSVPHHAETRQPSGPTFRVEPQSVRRSFDICSGLSTLASASCDDIRALLSQHSISVTADICNDIIRLKASLVAHFLSAACVTSLAAPGCCLLRSEFELDSEAPSVNLNAMRDHVFNVAKSVLDAIELRALLCELSVPCRSSDRHSSLSTRLHRYLAWRTAREDDLSGRDARIEAARANQVALEQRRAEISASWPEMVPDERKRDLVDSFRARTSSKTLARGICACCAGRFFLSEFVTISFADFPRDVLAMPSEYPAEIYPDDIPAALQPALLHMEGVQVEKERVTVCHDCNARLRHNKLPSLALANHIFTGDVPPELSNLTLVEEAMIGRARAKAWIVHLRADGQSLSDSVLPNMQRGLKGHTVIYPQRPGRLLDILPPSVDDVMTMICVVFVGAHPPDKKWLLERAKPLAVNRSRVLRALLWLKAHNPLYSDVTVDMTALSQLPVEGSLPFPVSHITESEAQAAATSRYDASSQLRESNSASADAVLDEGTNADVSPNDLEDVYQKVVIADINGNAPMSELRAATLRHFKDKGQGYVEVPHDPVPVNEFCNPDLFPMIYPSLFPYGVGGFEDKPPEEPQTRRVRVSLKRHVKHLLDIADRRFQTHPSFIFVAFNILQRREVLLRSSLRTKEASFVRVASQFSRVTAETIARVCEKVSAGIQVGADEDERRVFDLMNQVNLVSVNVPGSPASRAKMRNELRAMMIEYGLPSFYITVNPADVYNPIVRLLAGEEIDVDNLPLQDENQYWKQSLLVAKNPVVAAQFFNLYMNAFIDCLLRSRKTLEGEGGILGHVKAHFGCVEAQGRGTLHCHMVVWIEGALNPNEMRDRALSEGSEEFKRRLIQFIDDTISTSLPSVPDIVEETEDSGRPCAHPCSHRGPSAAIPPDLLDILRKKDLLQLVKACQVHTHNATCYKYCKPGEPRECRFDLDPNNTRPLTEFDAETGELCLRCLDGMVNNFNAVMVEAVRNNMDLKFIASGEAAKAILYYITDYITKTPLKAHVAYAALEVAVTRLEEQINEGDDLTVKAKKMIQKCAMFMITHQEMSGQQVSLSLLQLPDRLCNDDFSNLYWVPFERFVEKQDPSPECYSTATTSPDRQPADNTHVDESDRPNLQSDADPSFGLEVELDEAGAQGGEDDVIIEVDDDGVVRRRGDQVADYVHRGAMLESLSAWEFVARVRKVDGVAGDESLDISIHDFLLDDSRVRPSCALRLQHAEADRKVLQVCLPRDRKLPVPLGPALPRRDVEAVYAKYCRIMLVLFKPWRASADLRRADETWPEAFAEFVEGCDQRTRRLLDNMHIMNECKDCRDDHIRNRAHHLTRRLLPTEFTSRSYDDSGQDTFDDIDEDDLLQTLTSVDADGQRQLLRGSVHTDACVRSAVENGLLSIPAHSLPPPFTVEVPLSQVEAGDNAKELTWRHQYNERRAHWKKSLTVSETPTVDSSLSTAQEAVIRAVDDVPIRQPTLHASASTSPAVTPDSVIDKIASEWNLNKEQRRAFEIVARHADKTGPSSGSPLRMYLGGAGGTGKSTVISALKSFFDSRGESRRFRLCSFTGVAARNIHGSTLHSALALHQAEAASKKGSKVNEELVNSWEGVDYLFVDEVSMVGCRLQTKISRALSLAKGNDEPFGGISVIFAGDFAQLPCVLETRLYAHLDFAQYKPDTVFGKVLWLSVDTVVLLKQQMRQIGVHNRPFVQLLDRLRDGLCTPADFAMLNTRLLSRCVNEVVEGAWAGVPIIVTDNQSKDALNEQAVQAFARSHGTNVNWYYCKDVFRKKLVQPGELCDTLQQLSSGVTEQRLGRIPLVVGMPVIVTQNHDVHGGIVNGSVGTLTSLRFYEDEFGVKHLQSCVVSLADSDFDRMEGLREAEAPILPDEKTFKIRQSGASPLSIRRTQVPIQPGYAFTAHRVQGKSYSRIVVDLEGCSCIEAAYVMLSRVTSLDGLIILRPFKLERITASRDNARLKEDRRLHVLDLQTIVKHSDSELDRAAARTQLAQLAKPTAREPVMLTNIVDGDVSGPLSTIRRVLEDETEEQVDSESRPNKRRRHL